MAKVKQLKKKPMTLTIRATTPEEILLLDGLKRLTNARTFSGVIFSAGKLIPELQSRVALAEMQCEHLEKINKQQHGILNIVCHAVAQVNGYGKKFFKGEKWPQPELEME